MHYIFRKIIQEVGYMAQKMYNGNKTALSEIKCLQNYNSKEEKTVPGFKVARDIFAWG
jgi:hypothetical protein